MEKFIPKEKLSKKEKRALNSAQRTTWGTFNPVTRKAKSPKAYDRKKPPLDQDPDGGFFIRRDKALWTLPAVLLPLKAYPPFKCGKTRLVL